MSATPRSRTPSRSGTPALSKSPSRLVIPPSLRSVQSSSSLKSQSRPVTSTAQAGFSSAPSQLSIQVGAQTVPSSSASSVLNLDVNEGILLQDVDAEVDTIDGEEGNAVGHLDRLTADEESKRVLRDQLRRTLSKKQSNQDFKSQRSRRKEQSIEVDEITSEISAQYPPREYFILTDAGKPVYTSRAGGEDSDELTSMFGITQALISVFLDDGDKLRCINAGSTRITFLLRPPLYYVCVSSWKEPESVSRSHLEYLHLQILSIVSATQLRRIFERRTNFDLRRLLNGAETFLTSLLGRLEFDLAMSTSSLQCLKIEPSLRARSAESLVPTSKMKDILYVILIARGQVVSLIRPRKHSIHPADLHILLNTIHAPSILNSPASASWIPICLPKFNPSGFVNAYVSFLDKEEVVDRKVPDKRAIDAQSSASDSTGDQVANPDSGGSPSSETRHISGASAGEEALRRDIALVCISGGGEFESIREWCDVISQRMGTNGTIEAISKALRSGSTEYSVSELAIPGLRHFLYKSRAHVQITLPSFEDPYSDLTGRRRLVTLYQTLHDAIHAKSGQAGMLKLQYIRTEKESVMGWITQPFELYVSLSPWLPKSAVINAANAVLRWVNKEEGRLFLRDAPVF